MSPLDSIARLSDAWVGRPGLEALRRYEGSAIMLGRILSDDSLSVAPGWNQLVAHGRGQPARAWPAIRFRRGPKRHREGASSDRPDRIAPPRKRGCKARREE